MIKRIAAGIGFFLAAVIGVLSYRPAIHAAGSFTFTTLNVPGSKSTSAGGINGVGRIVGSFVNESGTHGFLFNNGASTTLDFPGGASTVAMGINNVGQIVGGYGPGNGYGNHGFLLSGGAFSSFDFPGSLDTVALGVNNSGQIVGSYLGNDGLRHGFRLSGGNYSRLDVPDINLVGRAFGFPRTAADNRDGVRMGSSSSM